MTDFLIRNLSVLSYDQGYTAWVYKAGQNFRAALAPDFFSSFADMFTQGDTIMVSAVNGGVLLFVDGKTSERVSVTPMASTGDLL